MQYFTEEQASLIEAKNCQNLIGGIVVPLGWAGPVLVEVHSGHDSPHKIEAMKLPLATTEGALVPSINRGCKAIRESGGAVAIVELKGMTRAPVFRCKDGRSAQLFRDWVVDQWDVFSNAARLVSSHLKFLGMQGWIEGRLVFIRCSFDPDQAMGMNMVTIATQKASEKLLEMWAQENFENEVELVALSSNVCTDKKQASINRLLGRGWWVQVEVKLPEEVVQRVLKTSSQKIVDVHVAKNLIGSYLAGDGAQNMQIANAAAAVLLATGQDVAHVVDISQGMTTFEKTEEGLYVAVTLPSIPVGVVGGGTWLPTQQEALKMITGELPTAAELATAIGVAALAGEISGMAALASHDLAKAHEKLGRAQVSAVTDQRGQVERGAA